MNRHLWKNAAKRAVIGAPIGLAISTAITIIISLAVGKGEYFAVVPELTADFGTEINAVLVQALCSMLYGAAFAGASVIWDADWSLTRMTIIHLLICSAATFPIAFLMRWMEHTVGGILLYFGIFLLIYLVIWISQYTRIKKSIAALNKKVNDLA